MDLTSVGAGLRAGAPLLAGVFAVEMGLVAVADDPSDAWAVVLLAVLMGAFARAGVVAARHDRERPLRQAAGAGLAVFAAWLPLRLIVAVVGDSENPFAGLGAGLALAVLVSISAALVATRRDAPASE